MLNFKNRRMNILLNIFVWSKVKKICFQSDISKIRSKMYEKNINIYRKRRIDKSTLIRKQYVTLKLNSLNKKRLTTRSFWIRWMKGKGWWCFSFFFLQQTMKRLVNVRGCYSISFQFGGYIWASAMSKNVKL